MSDDDRALLEAARRGDRHALEALLQRYQAQVYRFGVKMCRDPEDAKEVLQDTLLAMARGVRDFRGASSVSTWLYAIARSFCIKQRRKRKANRDQERSLDSETALHAARLVDPARRPDEALASKEIERALEQAIRALPPRDREVLVLRDMEGLSAAEVAEILGVSVKAIKSRLHRARLSLRAQLVPLLGLAQESAGAPRSTCPDVLRLYSQHLEGEISADLCAQMESHIESCDRCRSACDSLKRTLALCKMDQTAELPASVQDAVRIAAREFLAQD